MAVAVVDTRLVVAQAAATTQIITASSAMPAAVGAPPDDGLAELDNMMSPMSDLNADRYTFPPLFLDDLLDFGMPEDLFDSPVHLAMSSFGPSDQSVSVGPSNSVESALPCPSLDSLLDVVLGQSSPSDRSVSVGLSSQHTAI